MSSNTILIEKEDELLLIVIDNYFDDSVNISASKTIKAWKDELQHIQNKKGFESIQLKDFYSLNDIEAKLLAERAFENYFKPRLETRYLNPIQEMIDYVPNNEDEIGIGFSIVSLECILLEFLASMYSGKLFILCSWPEKGDNYSTYTIKNKKPYCKIKKNVFEKLCYNSSKNIFTSFLIHFDSSIFYGMRPDEFYEDIRCGLLHSLKTKKDWTIKKDEEFKYIDFDKKIIQRTEFFVKIKDYINTDIINKIKSDAQYARNFLFVLDCHFRR